MTKKPTEVFHFILLTVFFIISAVSFNYSQSTSQLEIEYVSPKPGSIYNASSENIIIKVDRKLDKIKSYNSLFDVSGSKSGKISGKILLSDNNTLIFKPYNKFIKGEIVTVNFSKDAYFYKKNTSNNSINFKIRDKEVKTHYAVQLFYKELGIKNPKKDITEISEDPIDSIPSNYPQMQILKFNDPSSGYIFMSVFGSTPYPSILISDNSGSPFYYQEKRNNCFDFKLQPNGKLTYFNDYAGKFYEINNNYQMVDSFQCGNGYETDIHELQILPDGHAFLLGIDPEIMDLSGIGGKSNATVLGSVIQELDQNKNVVFQWKSLDYVPVTDASDLINLTGDVVDYIHSNAICIDNDNNILLSSRHLSEVTKINIETGDIIWRLGGKENQFVFTNDPFKFSFQHDIRRISNGDITLMDNGNEHSPEFSRAVEYQLDEVNHTAALVWQYRNSPDYFSSAMGNVQRLPNGNTLIDWAKLGIITEVTPNKTKALEIKIDNQNFTYRAIKADWEPSIFNTNTDTLNFGTLGLNKMLSKNLMVSNNSNKALIVNDVYNSSHVFKTTNELPITLNPNSHTELNVVFQPNRVTDYFDTLRINSKSDTSLVSARVILIGSGTNPTDVSEENLITKYSLLQNYPNPFNPSTKIDFNLAKESKVQVTIYNLLGEKIKNLLNKTESAGKHSILFNAKNLDSGVYFYKLKAGNFVSVKKMILLK